MFKFRKIKTPMNRSLASAGLVAIIVGVVIALMPEIVIIAATIIIGLLFIGYGVLRLFVKMNVVNTIKKFEKEVNGDHSDNVVDVDVE